MPPVFDKDTKFKIVEYGSHVAGDNVLVILKNKILAFFKKG
jgi:3D (Asp-Asp-Asp) domain-containing protein